MTVVTVVTVVTKVTEVTVVTVVTAVTVVTNKKPDEEKINKHLFWWKTKLCGKKSCDQKNLGLEKKRLRTKILW